jgi:Chlorophyll A-B binding protein
MQLRELKNGRLAMVAVAGMVAQEAVTGQGPIEQLLVSMYVRICCRSAVLSACGVPLGQVRDCTHHSKYFGARPVDILAISSTW